MAKSRTFPLVRGRKMRVTALDGCGQPVYGDCSQIVTEGFISVALSAQINEGEAITVTTASGKTCVNDAPEPEFTGYTAELTFCNVDPALFALITGQEQVLDANDDIVGFRQASGSSGKGFALEVWAGVPGEACGPGGGGGEPSGYLLLPFLKGGVLGDFTIENAAITFSITGAATKGGSGWGQGPYNVQGNPAAPLVKPIGTKDHLHVQYVEVPPPADTDGCFPLFGGTHPGATAVVFMDDTGSKGHVETTGGSALVDWGDGHTDVVANVLEHTYAAPGTYQPRYVGAANTWVDAPDLIIT